MNHPRDLLSDYALDELAPAEARRLETHLETCTECRRELRGLREMLAVMVERLPAVAPPEGAWEAIRGRLAPQAVSEPPESPAQDHAEHVDADATPQQPPPRPAWVPLALAACLALAAIGVGWGVRQTTLLQRRTDEQAVVARWLARGDARVLAMPLSTEGLVGSLVILPNGRTLVVLNQDPPAGQSFQAWGHKDGTPTSLGVSEGRVFRVDSSGFDAVGVSLEPLGGSPLPTHPLGRAPL